MTTRICKVLVVEDNRQIQELMELVLIDQGYRFLAVATEAEMLAALETDENFDVAVIDYHLPGSANGLALARIAAAAGLGVIMVSGTGYKDAADAIQRSGHAYLRKPFRLKELLSAVETALVIAKRDCEREAFEAQREKAV